MSQQRSFITLSDEQAFTWYRHHVQVMHGYALALALKAGLSPAEAARTFVEPWHDSVNIASLPGRATAQILEQQARQAAEVLALTHGEEYTRVEQRADSWLVEVAIDDREPLERYGASLESHSQWIVEQLRLVCKPKGIHCSVELDSEMPRMRFSFQAAMS